MRSSLLALVLCLSLVGEAHAFDAFEAELGPFVSLGRKLPVADQMGGENLRGGLSMGLSARVRLLVLGLDLQVAPGAKSMSGGSLLAPSMEASLLLFVLPLRAVRIYGRLGMGGVAVKDALNPMGDTTTYHGGFGGDVRIAGRIYLGAGWTWVVPGAATLRRMLDPKTSPLVTSYAVTGTTTRIRDFVAGRFSFHLRIAFG